MLTVVPATKLVPVMVIGVSGDPPTMAFGVSEAMMGPRTLNELAAEEMAVEFFTVTATAPAVASCVLVTAAVIEVALT